jgi:cell wall-associated NlpC family hydrolase
MARVVVILLALAAGACASTGAIPKPFPTPGGRSADPTPAVPSAEPASDLVAAGEPGGEAIAGTALSLRGSPYRNGGSDPTGFDCSGFVSYVFAQQGMPVPRTVAELYRSGADVDSSGLRAGDLVFFDTNGAGVSHVGIAIGGDEFVHAPSTSGEVRVERLGTSYWSRRFVGARRVTSP